MFKLKAAALIAALAISTAANAGLVQYQLGAAYTNGATLNGYFLQDDVTRAIVHWNFKLMPITETPYWFESEYGISEVSSAFVSSYAPAPTNFTVFRQGTYPRVEANFNFAPTAAAGAFAMTGSYRTTDKSGPGAFADSPYISIASGGATGKVLTAAQVQQFKDMCDQPFMCVAPFAPQQLPEPGSIVLLGLAAAGLYSVRRRKPA